MLFLIMTFWFASRCFRAATVAAAVLTTWIAPALADGDLSVALFNAPASAALDKLVPEFEKATGLKVSVELLPYADLKAKVEQQFFTHAGTYDVIMADCLWIPSFVTRGFLGPMDISSVDSKAYDFDDLLPALDDYLGRYPQGGPRFGMPFMSNTHMMAYRPSIVKPVADAFHIRLPGDTPETAWTWDQYLKVASEISKRTPQIDLGFTAHRCKHALARGWSMSGIANCSDL